MDRPGRNDCFCRFLSAGHRQRAKPHGAPGDHLTSRAGIRSIGHGHSSQILSYTHSCAPALTDSGYNRIQPPPRDIRDTCVWQPDWLTISAPRSGTAARAISGRGVCASSAEPRPAWRLASGDRGITKLVWIGRMARFPHGATARISIPTVRASIFGPLFLPRMGSGTFRRPPRRTLSWNRTDSTKKSRLRNAARSGCAAGEANTTAATARMEE